MKTSTIDTKGTVFSAVIDTSGYRFSEPVRIRWSFVLIITTQVYLRPGSEKFATRKVTTRPLNSEFIKFL